MSERPLAAKPLTRLAVGKTVEKPDSALPLDTLCHLRWPLDPEAVASRFAGAAKV